MAYKSSMSPIWHHVCIERTHIAERSFQLGDVHDLRNNIGSVFEEMVVTSPLVGTVNRTRYNTAYFS